MNKDDIYKLIGNEISQKNLSPGPWARAIADSFGDKALAESLYVNYRFIEVIQDIESQRITKELQSLIQEDGFYEDLLLHLRAITPEFDDLSTDEKRILYKAKYSNSRQLYQVAYELHYKIKNYDQAKRLYERVITLYPQSEEASYAKTQLLNLSKKK